MPPSRVAEARTGGSVVCDDSPNLKPKAMAAASSPQFPSPLPAEVFACLVPGEVRLVILPGVGLASGGARYDVPSEVVPVELRFPNTPLWVELSDDFRVIRVWRRGS
jgi:hypothetical protein